MAPIKNTYRLLMALLLMAGAAWGAHGVGSGWKDHAVVAGLDVLKAGGERSDGVLASHLPKIHNEVPVARFHKNPLKRHRGRDGVALFASAIGVKYYHPLEIGKASTGLRGLLHPVLAAPSLRGPPVA
ncbi:MAG: hypothetical protein JST42_04305 [Bacteroidetes bacterium]|nr:hypothetical protein [Bacteroidota bacterium]